MDNKLVASFNKLYKFINPFNKFKDLFELIQTANEAALSTVLGFASLPGHPLNVFVVDPVRDGVSSSEEEPDWERLGP